MTGAYAKEFEKWLVSSKGESHSKSIDSASDDPDLAHTGDSEDEVDNPFGSLSSMETEGVTGDAAPMLSDDEDNDGEFDHQVQAGVKDSYEEEPPILEPVPSMPNRKQFEMLSVYDETKACDRTAQDGKMHPRSNSSVVSSVQLKDVNCKDKQILERGKKEIFFMAEKTKISEDHSCAKQSGNIFDKFITISEQGDDVPPPLIPSPEALCNETSSNGSGDENFNLKLPSNSPDFCAMEADSTSEIPHTNADDSHHSKKEKMEMTNSKSDVSIECDSTCMLGVSPNVVSPGFALNIDVDDAANQSDNQSMTNRDTEEEMDESHAKPLLNGSPINDISVVEVDIEMKEEDSANKSCSWDQECPTLEAAVNEEEEEQKEDNEHQQDSLPEEPPVLSVNLPASVQSLRKKRHTIDTVENIGSSAKRKYLKNVNGSTSPIRSEKRINIDSPEPPNLSRQAESDKTSPLHDNKHGKSSKKKKYSNVKKNCVKTKSRCRSYSFVDMRKFVKKSSQLSHLQSRMHKLVSLLFSQIKFELESMSPESLNFENVLIDVASSLQEGSAGDSEKSVLSCSKTSGMDYFGRDKQTISASERDDGIDISQPVCSPSSLASSHPEDSASAPKHSVKSNQTPFPCRDTQFSDDPPTGESMIPQLSQLTLTSEKETILKRQPSVVLTTNVYEASKSFTKLACDVLQLLLPDLTINLFDALGDSYEDLLNLIDSVILLNSG